jgi:hypothetical protein
MLILIGTFVNMPRNYLKNKFDIANSKNNI